MSKLRAAIPTSSMAFFILMGGLCCQPKFTRESQSPSFDKATLIGYVVIGDNECTMRDTMEQDSIDVLNLGSVTLRWGFSEFRLPVEGGLFIHNSLNAGCCYDVVIESRDETLCYFDDVVLKKGENKLFVEVGRPKQEFFDLGEQPAVTRILRNVGR